MKKFNINNTMYIHILPKGWEYLYKKYGYEYVEKCVKPLKAIIGDKEYYYMQCWDAFNTLPPCVGMDNLFEPDVLFNDNELDNIDIDI